MADKNEDSGNRKQNILRWICSAGIVLVIFGIVGANMQARHPKTPSPTDWTADAPRSQARVGTNHD